MQRMLTVAGALWGGTACSNDAYNYGDPLPPPPKCPGVAATIRGRVTIDGDVVTLTLAAPTAPDASFVTPPQIVVAGDLVLTGVAFGDGELVITMKFVAHVYDVQNVGVGVQCRGTFGSVVAYVETPRDGGPPGVDIIDD